MTGQSVESSAQDALLEALKVQFAVFRNAQPLALGIHKAVMVRMPDVDAAALRSALRRHTASTRYLKALVSCKQRFDLDGQATGEVSDAQRELADATLRERFKKTAERRKADEAARKALEASQQRQEKLAQLAARFSRR